jgi:chromosome segregation ATPase
MQGPTLSLTDLVFGPVSRDLDPVDRAIMIDDHITRISEFEAELEEARGELEDLKEAENERATAQRELEDLQKEHDELTKERDELARKHEECAAGYDRVKIERDQLEARIADGEGMAGGRKQCDELAVQLRQLIGAIDGLSLARLGKAPARVGDLVIVAMTESLGGALGEALGTARAALDVAGGGEKP